MVRSPGTATVGRPARSTRAASRVSTSGPQPRPSAPPQGSSSYSVQQPRQRRVAHLDQVELAALGGRVGDVDVGVRDVEGRRARHQSVHERVEDERVVRARREGEPECAHRSPGVARRAPAAPAARRARRAMRQAARSRGPIGLEIVRSSANADAGAAPPRSPPRSPPSPRPPRPGAGPRAAPPRSAVPVTVDTVSTAPATGAGQRRPQRAPAAPASHVHNGRSEAELVDGEEPVRRLRAQVGGDAVGGQHRARPRPPGPAKPPAIPAEITARYGVVRSAGQRQRAGGGRGRGGRRRPRPR